jgi:hypothetical protein
MSALPRAPPPRTPPPPALQASPPHAGSPLEPQAQRASSHVYARRADRVDGPAAVPPPPGTAARSGANTSV